MEKMENAEPYTKLNLCESHNQDGNEVKRYTRE
jgi:hypothetical protein